MKLVLFIYIYLYYIYFKFLTVKGIPLPSVEWYFEGAPVRFGYNLEFHDNSLTISNAKRNFIGDWSCKVKKYSLNLLILT